jgi:phosphoribosylaminoimidazole-succinocarboxamide synthase
MVPELAASQDVWAYRSMLVKRTKVVMIECVVRGYITGSAWSEYRKRGSLAGEPLPEGLQESQKMDPPIFSPATKAETGHDENITFAQMCSIVGEDLATKLRDRSLAIYSRGRDIAEKVGIILADTKFEFGILPDGSLILIDEVLTPDSSRFWPRDTYAVGRGQPSLDKQPVRDYLERLVSKGEWNKEPPPPQLPADVVKTTSDRYLDVFKRLTGFDLNAFPTADPTAKPPTC